MTSPPRRAPASSRSRPLRHRVLGVSEHRGAVGSGKQTQRPRVTILRLTKQSLGLAAEQIDVGIRTVIGGISFHVP